MRRRQSRTVQPVSLNEDKASRPGNGKPQEAEIGSQSETSHKRIKRSSTRNEGEMHGEEGETSGINSDEGSGNGRGDIEIQELKMNYLAELNELKERNEALMAENESLQRKLEDRDVEINDLKLKIIGLEWVHRRGGDAKSEKVKMEMDNTDHGCDMTSETFQKFLKNRKGENKRDAEQKRLEGLKTIAERKSRSGINPLERFPKEIWAKIMEELTPQDRLNMREVHVIFRDLTESNLLRDILFPLLISNDLITTESRSPNGLFYEMKRILRPVSKSLRDSVDQFVANFHLHEMRTTGIWTTDIFYPRYKFSVANNQYHIRLKCTSAFTSGPVDQRPKKLVERAIRVSIVEPAWNGLDDDDAEELPLEERRRRFQPLFDRLMTNLTELVEVVGDQILYFDFRCEEIKKLEELGITISQIYGILRGWLVLMPKLKWLKLQATGLKSLPKQTSWIRQATSGIQEHPMPTLEELERVDMTVQSTVHSFSQGFPIWDSILTANPQIKYFTYHNGEHGIIPYYGHYIEPSVLSLPCLETVRVGCRLRMWDFPLLQKISTESKWNLKHLELMMNVKKKYKDVGTLNGIIECLGKFPNLEDLSLAINHVQYEGPVNFLILPNLKKLRIEIGPTYKIGKDKKFHHFFSLQFLLHCGKLEELVFHNLHNDASCLRRQLDRLWLGHNDGIVDFKSGLGDLSGSNCWDVFPKLRSIKVQFREWLGTGDDENRERRFCRREYRDRKMVNENTREWKMETFFE